MVEFAALIPQVGLDLAELANRARVAESCGYRSVWLIDHLCAQPRIETPIFEAWTAATVLAERTERIRIGHLVLCNSFRHPALLAKMAATLDHVSGGRLELGLGWGSVAEELRAFGIGDEPPATRSARLRETLEILPQLFTGEPVDYQGRFYTLRGAMCRPRPLQDPLPIFLGGAGPKLTMPLVAKHAHWWNCVASGVDRIAELIPLAGSARISVQHPIAVLDPVRDGEAERARALRRFAGWGSALVGTPDEIAEELVKEVAMGAELFIFAFSGGGTPDALEQFMRDVAPRVRSAAPSSRTRVS
jgi:alkanesulfonate monooxygenase SsuD/methylene tetrahydromethanopterin reductase-like flavin-dependent oxidoreductase (luciferase family)